MIGSFLLGIFPLVSRELKRWRTMAAQIPEVELRTQALASIRDKKFHVQGGSAYALDPRAEPAGTVRFIVALQTISDYLDNLCDRAGVTDESAFFTLHRAMLDAVDPAIPVTDYYHGYPYQNDGGYLASLVASCRSQLRVLPSYPLVLPVIKKYIGFYSELESYKHLDPRLRESRLRDWAGSHRRPFADIYWWEFAAATGSTLGMFQLYAAAADPRLCQAEVDLVDSAYFPWVSGLHILLDYFIDAGEDREMGDLNFTFQYPNLDECYERLEFFKEQSETACRQLPNPGFHLTIIRGLLAMYLSDPKALTPALKEYSLRLVRSAGMRCGMYHRCCIGLRKAGVI
jgi:tetraprenyl-beta-curcumene synthase